jgi:hypothetical protein
VGRYLVIRAWDCDRGIAIAPSLYRRFKDQVVARWPGNGEWRITAGQVRQWLAAAGHDTTTA